MKTPATIQSGYLTLVSIDNSFPTPTQVWDPSSSPYRGSYPHYHYYSPYSLFP